MAINFRGMSGDQYTQFKLSEAAKLSRESLGHFDREAAWTQISTKYDPTWTAEREGQKQIKALEAQAASLADPEKRDEASSAAKQEEALRARLRQGRSSTILTNPLGGGRSASIRRKTLLGG